MKLIQRVQDILFHPGEAWHVIDTEASSASDLYKSYIMPLAAIGPICSFIGLSFVGISIPFVGTYRVPIGLSLGSAVTSYILTLLGVFVLALIINGLAPYFQAQPSTHQALKVATYSSTPAWIAGIFSLLPWFGILGLLLSLYSLYILYLGLPVLMKSPQEKALRYTAVVVVTALAISIIIAFISHKFIGMPQISVQHGPTPSP